MKNRLLLGFGALAIAAIVACGDSTKPPASNTVTFTATLTTASETPAPTGTTANATGTFTGVLDTVTNIFTYDVAFSGLSSNVTLGHIHGPADAGVVASPILTFNSANGQQFTTGATSGTARGTWPLDGNTSISATVKGDSLRKLMFAGKTYVNIHTSTNGPGEVRGQISKKP